LIVSLRSERAEWIDVIPKLDIAFLPRSWHQYIRDPDEPDILNRRFLEVTVFLELAEALQAGEIYVPGSRNYDTYTDRLYPIESAPEAVSAYLKARGLPDNAKAFVTQLREWLGRHISGIDSLVGELGVVQLNAEGKPIVPRPPAIKPTDSALALETVLLERLPRRTILEALYNTDSMDTAFRAAGAHRTTDRQPRPALCPDQLRVWLWPRPDTGVATFQGSGTGASAGLRKPPPCQHGGAPRGLHAKPLQRDHRLGAHRGALGGLLAVRTGHSIRPCLTLLGVGSAQSPQSTQPPVSRLAGARTGRAHGLSVGLDR
jgi:hypothetical protein